MQESGVEVPGGVAVDVHEDRRILLDESPSGSSRVLQWRECERR